MKPGPREAWRGRRVVEWRHGFAEAAATSMRGAPGLWRPASEHSGTFSDRSVIDLRQRPPSSKGGAEGVCGSRCAPGRCPAPRPPQQERSGGGGLGQGRGYRSEPKVLVLGPVHTAGT